MNIDSKSLTKMRIQNISLKRALASTILLTAVAWVWSISGLGIASAEEIETINASVVVPAPIDKVWSIVADVDKDPRYWSVYKEIKNVNTTSSNVTERNVTLNINNDKAHQIITLHPKDSILLNQTEGPITGTRTMTLSVSNNHNNDETKIDVLWKVDLSKIPIIGKGFAKDGIFKTTEEALKKIAEAAK